MPLSSLLAQPMVGLAWALAILVSIGIHEFAHAAAAHRLGDTTASDAGRLTLNPLAHVDLMGFLMLLLVGFGWGKPVPYDPERLRFRRWGPTIVALAGPTANLVGIVVAGALLVALDRQSFPANNLLIVFVAFLLQFNLVLLLFNLIPIPPLDGSAVLLRALDRPRYDRARFFLETRGPLLLLGLVIVDQVLGGVILGRLFGRALAGAVQLIGTVTCVWGAC